jgi:16S rRNA (guanine527-N7)-methyltransferase
MKHTPTAVSQIETFALEQELVTGAQSLSLKLTKLQIEQIIEYVKLLHKWSAVYNLTAIKSSEDILVQHIMDCLSIIQPILQRFKSGISILDVGSGAGLPAVMIAIACPEHKVTALDAVAKKVAFIKQASLLLNLPNLSAKHGRVERECNQKYDLIVSRAFSSLNKFVNESMGALVNGGVWMAMKGKLPVEEMTLLPLDVSVFDVTHPKVPGMLSERCLVWMSKGESLGKH